MKQIKNRIRGNPSIAIFFDFDQLLPRPSANIEEQRVFWGQVSESLSWWYTICDHLYNNAKEQNK